ncbi:hypothetical protein E1211_17900 [Micromonospora sp. 15K316]|uniref:hypothetical protein n=1 Tax=Micromonospora sp. 15K316 TaxID=2530376 RepID=UPI0010449DEA|nr:hypothetical protein [Micromonospora sp. 15K316]TDC34221.1 hypothetical protein E1211_17900 [Micromonospora sp. 15K316]
MSGNTPSRAAVDRTDTAARAATATVTDPMGELLTAVRDYRVVNVGGRWVIDVSWLGRAALDAGLVAQVGEVDRTLLKLTRTGRVAVSHWWTMRALTAAVRVSAACRRAYDAGVEAGQATTVEPVRRHRLRRAVVRVAWSVSCIACGVTLALAVLAH